MVEHETRSPVEAEFFDPAPPPATGPEVDDELLALAPPPLSPKQGLIALGLTLILVVMMVWFWPDLRYALRGFSAPRALGEVTELGPGRLESNTWVQVEGLPRITKSITFNEGTRWFAGSDVSCRFFPLAGHPGFFVQWRAPEESRKYRDPKVDPSSPLLPSSFSGRLLSRADLSRNYDKVWTFLGSRMKLAAPPDAWVLVDGLEPSDKFWVIGLYGLLLALVTINLLKLRRFWRAWRA